MRTFATLLACGCGLALSLTLAACNPDIGPTGDASQQGTATDGAAPLPLAEQPGPAVGDPAPVVTNVVAADGSEVALRDLAGPNGTVLVFVRSVDWCPFCQQQLTQLRDIAADVDARGYTLAALSYDTPAQQAEFAAAQDIGFALVSDQDSAAIDAFGLRDPQYTEGRAAGVPFASIFVLNPDGTVAAKSVSSDYRIRPTNDEVLRLLGS